MDLGSWWILDVIGPILLLLLLIWLILDLRSDRDFGLKGHFEPGLRNRYRRTEKRRPGGTGES